MTPKLVEYPLSSLDQGRAGAFVSMGWEWWNRYRGEIAFGSDQLEPLLSRMYIDVVTNPHQGPRLLYVGHESPSATVFGTDWARRASGEPGVPDCDFERAVNAVYWQVVSSREPAYAEISAMIHPPNRRAVYLTYRRLIVPCQLRTGAPVLAGFTEFVEPPGGRGARGFDAPSIPDSHLH